MRKLVVLVFSLLLLCPTIALASEPLAICVPAKASTAVKTPNEKGECPTGNTLSYAVGAEEQAPIQYLRLEPVGATGEPTIVIRSGIDLALQGAVRAGQSDVILGGKAALAGSAKPRESFVTGKANEVNGTGLIVTGEGNTSTSQAFGSFLGGLENHLVGVEPFEAAILSGDHNEAHGQRSSILGGNFNQAWGNDSSIVAGRLNLTESSAKFSAILGGEKVTLTGESTHSP